MTQLAVLRSRLQSLRLARAIVRWGSALALLVIGLAALWGAAFLLDWMLHGSKLLRAVSLAGWFAGLALLARTLFGPLLRRSESLEQLALWVEGQHRLDGDLISALQFESPAARSWGSPRLSAAVVEYVAEFSRDLDVFTGFTWQPLPRRLAAALGTVVLAAGLIWAFPAHASAFWNRFWLGSSRYPTRTMIETIAINGRPVASHQGERVQLAVPQDQPVTIEVRLRGELPAEAVARVRGLRSGEGGSWRIPSATPGVFQSEQRPLVESVRLWVQAGDAESDPMELTVVPLPMVDLQWSVSPPAYAGTAAAAPVSAGLRTFAVLQGSQATLQVVSVGKPLRDVALIIGGGEERHEIPLVADDPAHWRSPIMAPLDSVQQALTYELRVTDADGLSPQPTIAGEIRLQADRPPRATIAAVSRKVLPQAQPRVSFSAMDDFGLGEIRLEWESINSDGRRQTGSRILRAREPGQSALNTVRGETTLDLRQLPLAAGDELRLAIAADDDRGALPAQVGRSESLVLQITDKQGILESLLEIDQQSAQQLDAIIEKELGIGGPSR